MKYNNTDDKYLQQLNDIADKTNYYSNDPRYRIIPQGNNQSKSISLYYYRLNYELQFGFATNLNSLKSENFKDYIYTHNLYGKLNLTNDVININEDTSLKTLTSNYRISLLAPAADAFNDLFNRHKALVSRGVIREKSKLYNIKPERGFISPNLLHSEYTNNYFNQFYKFINDNKINKKILDFKSFIKYFIYFYNQNNTLINKTEFIKSNLCTPLATGVVVEFGNDKHGDDKNVFLNYVTDENFGIFDTLTKQHGFVMDKHSPWRLTFDIASANAKQYLEKYNVSTLNQYFETFYYFTEYFNFETLKINLINLYNFIIQEEPTINQVNTTFKNGKICISEKQIIRQILAYDDLNKQILEEDLLKIYFYTKIKENNCISSENQFNQSFEQISTSFKFVNIIKAFDLINEYCKKQKNTGDEKFTMNFF